MEGLSLKPAVGLDQVKPVITGSLWAAQTAASVRGGGGKHPDARELGTFVCSGLGFRDWLCLRFAV